MSRAPRELPIGIIMASLRTVRVALVRAEASAEVELLDEVVRLLDRRSPGAIRQERYRSRSRDASVTPGVTGSDAERDASVTQIAPPRNAVSSPVLISDELQSGVKPRLLSSCSPSELLSAPPDKPSSARARDASVTPTSIAWNPYALEYQRRYGIAPTRNARVNGQLTHFMRLIPLDDVVITVTHYVRSQNARYVASGHSIGCLLQDAEKLRTEALTGRNGTAAAARRADQRADRSGRYSEMLARLDAEDEADAAVGGGDGE